MKRTSILCLLLLFILTGCTNTAAPANTDTEEVALLEDSSVNPDEATWKANCDSVKASLSDISWIASVEISPDSYEEYSKNKKAIIYVTPVADAKVTDQDKKSIDEYISNTGAFEQFDVTYIK